MSGRSEREVTVPNPQGVHARPSYKLQAAANRYAAAVTITNLASGETVNAKSMVDLLTLNAPQGTRLRVTAEGDDAIAAAQAVVAVVEGGFDEMEG